MHPTKILRVAAVLLLLTTGTNVSAKTKHVSERHGQANKLTLEQLDSAANLLLTVADGDRPGACGIAPAEGRKLLMALHPIIDEKMKGAIAALSAKSKPIANPKWDETCLRKCHCGLYASILEGVGETRLTASDRAALDRMESKARVMTREHLLVCARTSSWFCSSTLLTQLREEAKAYPDPKGAPATANSPKSQ